MTIIGVLPFLLSSAVFDSAHSADIKKLNGEVITRDEVDKVVHNLMDTANVTGLCMAVLNGNESVYLETFGYRNRERSELLDENSILLGASFSKVILAYVVMQLVQEDVLPLDRPLYTYLGKPLPEYEAYKDLVPDERWKLISARHCLSHSTGFPNLRSVNPRGSGKLEFFFTPGTRYAYSGEGIQLLQFVVEHITHKGLEELARERVFTPLGMSRTSFVWQDRFKDNVAVGHDVLESPVEYHRWTQANGGGSLLTTIADYTKFIEAMMQGKGLDASIRHEMLSPSIRIHSEHQFPTLSGETTNRYDSIDLSYGLGWGLFASEYGEAFFKEGHGNGWQNYNVNFVDKKTSIIIMTNSDNGEKIFKDILEKVIGDTYTPWEWEGYVPYYLRKPVPIGVYLYDVIMFQGVDRAIETFRRVKSSSLRNSYVFGENQLNDLGYQMIKETKLIEAIKLFELNVEEYPKSARAYDGCGEAYMKNGQSKRAIEKYERSLELNPENDNAREMLLKLRGVN